MVKNSKNNPSHISVHLPSVSVAFSASRTFSQPFTFSSILLCCSLIPQTSTYKYRITTVWKKAFTNLVRNKKKTSCLCDLKLIRFHWSSLIESTCGKFIWLDLFSIWTSTCGQCDMTEISLSWSLWNWPQALKTFVCWHCLQNCFENQDLQILLCFFCVTGFIIGFIVRGFVLHLACPPNLHYEYGSDVLFSTFFPKYPFKN